MRRYFPDFFIKYKDKDSNIRRSVIKGKPMRETLSKQQSKSRKTMINESMTYVKNQLSEVHERVSADRKLEFKIMTEKELESDDILQNILGRVSGQVNEDFFRNQLIQELDLQI